MKTTRKNCHILGFTLIDFLVIFTLILTTFGVIAVMTIQPVMESRTYNKLTGAKTTWWDAVWVELRVQDQPEK